MDVMGIKIGPQAEQLARKRDVRRVYKADRQSTSDSKEDRTIRKKAKSEEAEESLSKSGYKKHEHKLLKVVTDVAKDSMCNAAKEIAENFNKNEYGVSVDGTWQHRGHTSLNGCINGKYRLGSYVFIVLHLQNMLL
ncbi:hypothetical protein CDAR_508361 [Caerostris darwini]|uniref:Mutator-like transposase domain-containing protein n=1 Tax=Caerostris darwini TaxID=1538125 RepID=A0AAV4WUT2_9ARAC|nr:hypothetical protein CDAR_508361 [Caerostris darwini]